MMFRGRPVMRWALGACFAALWTGASAQQGYPVKPLRIIVPLARGGPSDILARTVAQQISPTLGQSVVVENRTGAGGTIGTDVAAKSPPDGYTMLLIAVSTYTPRERARRSDRQHAGTSRGDRAPRSRQVGGRHPQDGHQGGLTGKRLPARC